MLLWRQEAEISGSLALGPYMVKKKMECEQDSQGYTNHHYYLQNLFIKWNTH